MNPIVREKKIPGGKLLQVSFYVIPASPPHLAGLESFRLTGDFFIHPEESIYLLESVCASWKFPSSKASRIQSLAQLLSQHAIEVVGFSPVDLVELVEEAVDASE